jgi:ABC-2 type transport system permease protein
MFETTLHTLRDKRSGILAFSVFIFIFGIVMVAAYDSIGSELDMDELLKNYPDVIMDFFGGDTIESFGEFGGFYTLEYVTWVWFLIIPAYLAMVCSGLIAGEIENKTADTLLSYPVSRRRLLVEKYLAVVGMVAIVNFMGFFSTYIGVAAYGIDYSVKWVGLAMVQATPFLLVWTAAFTLFSVVLSDAKKVSTYSIALVFIAYFIDVLSNIWSEISFLGNLSPMNYFDPGLAMSKNVVTWGDAAFLLIVACMIVGAAIHLFDKKDIL